MNRFIPLLLLFSGARIGTARCNYENSHGKFRGQARFTDNHYGATVSNAAATGSVGFYDSGMFLGRSAVVSGIAELVSLSLPLDRLRSCAISGRSKFRPQPVIHSQSCSDRDSCFGMVSGERIPAVVRHRHRCDSRCQR